MSLMCAAGFMITAWKEMVRSLIRWMDWVFVLVIRNYMISDLDFQGMMSVKCHQKFKRCIKKVKKSGKIGFSKKCPYEIVIPTMIQGMDMAILFSQLGGDSRSHTEL